MRYILYIIIVSLNPLFSSVYDVGDIISENHQNITKTTCYAGNDYDVEDDIEVSTLRIYGDNTPGSATAIPTFGGALATVYEDSSLIIDYSNLQQFFGEDSLIYSICDETELCDTTTVIINVEQDQLPPDIYNILTDKDTVLYKVDDVTISASVKDSIPLQDVSLFVSEGGKNSFQPFNLYQTPIGYNSKGRTNYCNN